MTFDQWYRGLPNDQKPQVTDTHDYSQHMGIEGRPHRVVFMDPPDPTLWSLDDYVVSSRCGAFTVRLCPR